MDPLVSVVIPAHNAAQWLGQAIASSLGQSWPRIEVVVVDDGSVDETWAVAKRFASNRVAVIHQDNAGVSAARNVGARLAQGEFLQWLDADDLLERGKISSQIAAVRDAGTNGVATGPFGAFYYQTRRARFRPSALWRSLRPLDWIVTRFQEDAWMASLSWLVGRSVSERAGPWNQALTLDEDGEYFTRIVSQSECVQFVPAATSYYRRGLPGSLSNSRNLRSMESLLCATRCSITSLRALRDDPRTRSACLAFLQHRINYYCTDRPDWTARFQGLAAELGGRLQEPALSPRPRSLGILLGARRARHFTALLRSIQARSLRGLDALEYALRARLASAGSGGHDANRASFGR